MYRKEAERVEPKSIAMGKSKLKSRRRKPEKNKTKPLKSRKRVLIRSNAKPNLVFRVKSMPSRKRMTVRRPRLKKKASNGSRQTRRKQTLKSPKQRKKPSQKKRKPKRRLIKRIRRRKRRKRVVGLNGSSKNY